MADLVPRRPKSAPRSTDSISVAEAEERPGGGAAPVKAAPRQPPWERESLPAEGGSFGLWLRRQREMREISLREIADRTKISLRYLEAMEADRFDLLPAPIFAKGFLREFARYVGLSPDDVVNHYLSVHKPEDAGAGDEEVRVRPKIGRSNEPLHTPMRRSWSYGSLLALAGLVLLILVAVAAYFADHRRESPDSQQTPPIAAPPPAAALPAAAAAAPQLPVPTSPLTVSLDFSQDCWVEALIDGKQRLSELRVQGEALQLDAQKSVSLTLGNAGAVSVHVNGLPFDVGRKQGDVVRDLVIDLEILKALREKRGSAAP